MEVAASSEWLSGPCPMGAPLRAGLTLSEQESYPRVPSRAGEKILTFNLSLGTGNETGP